MDSDINEQIRLSAQHVFDVMEKRVSSEDFQLLALSREFPVSFHLIRFHQNTFV